MGNYSEASSNAPIPNPETAISGRILINYINIILDLAAAAFEVPDKNFYILFTISIKLAQIKVFKHVEYRRFLVASGRYFLRTRLVMLPTNKLVFVA